jgi:hypothetical protein
MITHKGAWFLPGFYRTAPALVGTNGESLESDSDNLGWACFSWKYELVYNGFRGKMLLDTMTLGDAAGTQIAAFQASKGLKADRAIGPRTGKALLEKRIRDNEAAYKLTSGDLFRVVAQESGFDLGAIGWVDQLDRGCTQKHIYAGGSVTLSQAIRPAFAMPRLASQLQRVGEALDREAALASWNCGEGGAEWWFRNGKPSTGGPTWFPGLGERATAYLAALASHTPPY